MSRDIKAGGAYVELLLRDANFVAGLRKASGKLRSFGESAKRIGSLGFLGGGGGIGKLLAGAGAAAALAWPLKLAANLQVTKAEFEAMIGDAAKANKLFAEMQAFALVSPLGIASLSDAGKKLLVAGMAVDEIMPKLRQLGEVAGGDGEKLNRLSLAFAQTISKGRLMGQEANQMAESGFSPLAEISRTTGESMKDLMKRMEAGGVTVAEVSNAFKTATSEGGRFKGLLEKIAGTAIGQFNQFKEGVEMAVTPLGEALLPALTNILKKANEVLPGIAKMAKENASSFMAIATGAVGVVAAGSALISLGIGAKITAISLSALAGTIGLLFNPITLVTGAVAGLGYWFLTSTTWGQQMVTSLADWFGKLRTIAVEAFSGIADALASGDIVLAWKVTTLGIQAAWLQATNGLRETWASFRQVFVQSTLDMLYGAQSHWASFVNSIQSLLASVETESRSFGERVGHALTRSSDPDLARDQDAAHDNAMNRIAQEGAAEQQRIANKKGAELAAIEEQRRAAKEIAEGAFFGEMERINKDLAAAKAELAKARQDAAKARAAGGLEAIGGAKAFDPANFKMDAGKLKGEIFGSFNSAALAAQGGAGGNVQNKILDEIKAGNKAQEKLGAKQLAAIKAAGVLGP